ncbi:MAG: outer membrane protein assembly factor BamE [Candidatus Accumulibacter sp.]|nr:outer membrane protein assembly factor BamE [Accumulibacter sp.]
MFKRLLTGLFSGLIAAVLPACDGVNLGKLRPGVTTMAQTRDIMGPPAMEWQDADGSATWEYPRTPNGMVNYMIDFGPDKVLRKVRQAITEENFARVREGMTRDQIRRLLGQPASEQYYALRKEYVWDWKTKTDSAYGYFFDVYFDEQGLVTRTGTHYEALSGG